MAWIYLLGAGIFEMVWVVAMKYAEGFTKIVPSVIMIIGMIFSVGLLGLAVKTIPLGTGYAIWTGIGAVGAVTYGMIFFGEPVTVLRLTFVAMIIVGLVGLKLVSAP
ncbi:MAG: multidrug efflux SMR transporter [Alphaproteobacteria bacterium]|nr:multidrug efflux SMR transporter [Alphaproteobacteria bacterium]